ncbi:MAG: tRNA lysidine(34) synthetase TilS [Verrucomicrobiota bacterium]
MLAKLKSVLKNPVAPLLAGVSGGADSAAMLDALVRLGYRPHICHLNHRWRGVASDADAEFVQQLAIKYGLPVTIEVRKVAHTEAAARQARHFFFERVAKRTGIATLVLAHTADDQAETFLLRLLRGAGLTGLAGIWPDRQIGKLRVVRPMLDVSRQEVLRYLAKRKLKHREDASNADRRFLRNRVRHELLPLLEREFNPGIRGILRQTAEIMRAEAGKEPSATQRRAIRQQLGNLSFRQVEEMRKQLPVAPPVSRATSSSRHKNERFDADALGDQFTIRTWQPGDRFQPLGMKGEKKLQDFFVDEKIPRQERSRILLLCAADGQIAWVVGHRIAEPFKVTGQTRRVLTIRFDG